MKRNPVDFMVDENLGFDLSGNGEHCWLFVEKTGLNTLEVAQRLSSRFGVHPRDVAYSGLKDKQAITRQWFSLPAVKASGCEPGVALGEGACILARELHSKKLRRGAHASNRFTLTLHQVSARPEALEQRLRVISETGVPNYFGEQRFGFNGGNLDKATAYFAGRIRRANPNQKGLWISAARSYLFNAVLAARVGEGHWDRYLPGDLLGLRGSRSYFCPDSFDAVLAQRLLTGDVNPTGPLWGRGPSPVKGLAAVIECKALEGLGEFQRGLEQENLDQERRKLRLYPQDLRWQWMSSESLQLSFELEAGAFATMVVRELLDCTMVES